jgi:glycosyltransferase involved in cell wall biosynthesis
MLKILIISPFLPYPPDSGGAIRIYNLLKYLSISHKITLLCYSERQPEEYRRELLPYCELITIPQNPQSRRLIYHARYLISRLPYSLVYIDTEFEKALTLTCRRGFDIVQFEFLSFAHYVNRAPQSVKTVAVEHYIATESRARLAKLLRPGLKKTYYGLDLLKIAMYEHHVLNHFDLCLVTSREDKGKLLKRGIRSKIALSPNGVDTGHFRPLNDARLERGNHRNPSLVYIGAFHLEPANVDGLEYLLEHLLPPIEQQIPGVTVEVIGRGLNGSFMEKYGRRNVFFHGYVEDVRPILGRARALLLPLRGGSGTKIRVLTAMAMGVPVVATPMAAEGIEAKHEEHVLLGDTPEDLARYCVSLLSDRDLNKNMGSAGRKLVEDKYSWETVAQDLDRVYRELL